MDDVSLSTEDFEDLSRLRESNEYSKFFKLFLTLSKIPEESAEAYVSNFLKHDLRPDLVTKLNDELLFSLGVEKVGHKISILALADEYGSRRIKKPRLIIPISHSGSQNTFAAILDEPCFVDKTDLISEVIQTLFKTKNYDQATSDKGTIIIRDPVLILGPRRFGKTTNLHMLQSFFGGTVPIQKFNSLAIGKNADSMQWFGRFSVVYSTFGWASSVVTSVDECVSAFRRIIHTTFLKNDYVVPFLDEARRKSFLSWTEENVYTKKEKHEVLTGLPCLVDCLEYCHQKPVILVLDEFDRLCSKALFTVQDSNIINGIVDVHSDGLGQVVKHSKKCFGVFTGVSNFTSGTLSSLSNLKIISFMNDPKYAPFYGITEEEFTNVLSRDVIPESIKEKKNSAMLYYNGYIHSNLRIMNIYSITKFIDSGLLQGYGRESGVAAGLSEALTSRKCRLIMMKLLNDEIVSATIQKTTNITDFRLLSDHRYEITSSEFIINFLYQQGYVTAVKYEGEEMPSKFVIPNLEIKTVICAYLKESFSRLYNFCPEEIRKCSDNLFKVNIANNNDCRKKMKSFKNTLNKLLGSTLKIDINESWIEAFLFQMFFQSFTIETQAKIIQTARKKNMTTAKVLDLFIETDKECFVFEESLIENSENTLAKLIEKKYYLKATDTKKPYLLIAASVGKTKRGYVDVSIRYLRNTFSGVGEEV